MKRLVYALILLSLSLFGLIIFQSFPSSKLADNLGLAFVSSGLFACLAEISLWFHDRIRFSFLKGEWRRIRFYNETDAVTDTKYTDRSDRFSQVNNLIQMKYVEDGVYSITPHYDTGPVKGTLCINKDNILTGSGSYQYNNPGTANGLPDIGLYEFSIDESKKKLFIRHQNVLPSGLAKGLEIWVKD